MAAVIVLICVLGVLGLAGTISRTMLKVSENRQLGKEGELAPRLLALESENRELRLRIENLETIVTTQHSWDERFSQATGDRGARLPNLNPQEAPEVQPAQVAASRKG